MAEIDAVNPFCTPQFLEARTQQGDQPCLFHLNNQNEMAAGCFGFLRGKFLRRSLQIVSLPRLPDADSFWHGLWEFCLQSRIWHLQVDSYASPEAQIPILPGETARRERFEYILDLSSEDFQKRVSTNHGRNISRAVSAGLVIRRARESEALTDHVSLMRSSLDRRMKRGEQVELDEDASLLLALLSCNAGELFQAVENTRVVASVLVLRSQFGAYYQSAGTSERGMEIGASPFLISGVGGILRQEGVRIFNLGGASPENTGLRRFKAGFGARELPLTAASFCPRPAIQRGVQKTLKTLREKQKAVRWRLGRAGSVPREFRNTGTGTCGSPMKLAQPIGKP
jgi:hypothetical protein